MAEPYSKDVIFVKDAPDPPVGVWRQITHTQLSVEGCEGWLKTMTRPGESEAEVRGVRYSNGSRNIGYQVWARRLK